MLNGFLLKFIVKKNSASPDKGGYVLSSDNELYLYCPCIMQTYSLFHFVLQWFSFLFAYLFVSCYWKEWGKSLQSNVVSQCIYIYSITSECDDLPSYIQLQNYNSNT